MYVVICQNEERNEGSEDECGGRAERKSVSLTLNSLRKDGEYTKGRKVTADQ